MATARASRLRDIILKAGLVDELQMRSAAAHQEQWGGRLIPVLCELGFVDEDAATQALSEGLRLPVVHLGTVPKDAAALAKIDVQFCDERGVFPVSFKDRVLTVAMADPTDIVTIDAIQAKAGVRVSGVLSAESEIQAAISKHYRGESGFQSRPSRARQIVTGEVAPPPTDAYSELDLGPPPPRPSRQDMPRVGANTLLDEIMEVPKSVAGFSEEELARLEAARVAQEKTGSIIRAVVELLRRKGYMQG